MAIDVLERMTGVWLQSRSAWSMNAIQKLLSHLPRYIYPGYRDGDSEPETRREGEREGERLGEGEREGERGRDSESEYEIRLPVPLAAAGVNFGFRIMPLAVASPFSALEASI